MHLTWELRLRNQFPNVSWCLEELHDASMQTMSRKTRQGEQKMSNSIETRSELYRTQNSIPLRNSGVLRSISMLEDDLDKLEQFFTEAEVRITQKMYQPAEEKLLSVLQQTGHTNDYWMSGMLIFFYFVVTVLHSNTIYWSNCEDFFFVHLKGLQA